jgi:hypothetical protein
VTTGHTGVRQPKISVLTTADHVAPVPEPIAAVRAVAQFQDRGERSRRGPPVIAVTENPAWFTGHVVTLVGSWHAPLLKVIDFEALTLQHNRAAHHAHMAVLPLDRQRGVVLEVLVACRSHRERVPLLGGVDHLERVDMPGWPGAAGMEAR